MNKLILLSFSVLVFLSCAKENSQKFKTVTVPTTGDPILLNEDPRSTERLMTREGYIAQINTKNFKGDSSCSNVTLLSSTLLAGSYDFDGGFIFETQKPIPYRSCDENSKDGTYHYAAASIKNSLKKTEDLLDAEGVRLDRLTLRVTPLIKEVSQERRGSTLYKKSRYLVNNAFYYPGGREIVFLPQGRDQRGMIPFSSIPLWNIPFVASHEYGHHIFNSYFHLGKPFKGHTCFNSSYEKFSSFKDPGTNKKLVSAINEGFADLIAKISHPDKVSYKGVNCFEKSRDVESSVFMDGASKVLNSSSWKKFEFPENKRYFSCNTTMLFEIHHFGALIAHGLYSVMTELDDFKMKKLLAMIKNYNKNFSRFNDLKENMRELLSSYVHTFSRYTEKDKAEKSCDLLSKKFPLFSSYDICRDY